MRIAFVGKGGSGKTTLSALFSQFAKNKTSVLIIDADLNMHLAPLLGFETKLSQKVHLSHPLAAKVIKEYLRGKNERIKELNHFRKTTPPTKDSNFIILHDVNNPMLKQFSVGNPSFRLMTVGTYDTDDIGTSCYHNNLAILENILSHLIDTKGLVVTDMVAGVDAFANTLHAQFDMIVLAVEPTKLGLEVFNQYKKLADDAGVGDLLFAVGNKTRNDTDENFIIKHIPKDKLIGFLGDSNYLRTKDQEDGALEISQLEKENMELLATIYDKLSRLKPDYQKRLKKLYDLHRRYVAQGFIKERFGDLSGHIDESFNMQEVLQNYG